MFADIMPCLTENNQKFLKQLPWKDLELIHSEVCEMAENLRNEEGGKPRKMDEHCPAFPNEVVEAADIIIRVLGYLDKRGWSHYQLSDAIRAKLSYNARRQDHKEEVDNMGVGR